MSESRDLLRVADLLATNAVGYFHLNAIGLDAVLLPRFLRRTLPAHEALCWEREPRINVVPTRKPGEDDARAVSAILWGRTESGPAATRLRNFRPLPDIVIREGATVRYVAFWALEDPLLPWEIEDANKRLAKYLNNGTYATAGAGFTFHLPGSIVRMGRRSPLPVELVRHEPAVHRLEDVVGRLPDPPTDEQKREMFEAALERKALAEQRAKAEFERAAGVSR